jgi:hypothetical protein
MRIFQLFMHKTPDGDLQIQCNDSENMENLLCIFPQTHNIEYYTITECWKSYTYCTYRHEVNIPIQLKRHWVRLFGM